MNYDKTCLVVWPDWGSSGIWHPHERGIDGPMAYVGHDDIGLPAALSARFDKWIAWYDDYLPENKDAFPWEDFNQAGLHLAQDLAAFVGNRYTIEYNGKEITAA